MSNSNTEEEGGEEYYASQTVVNLRQLCKERGLKVGGKKQEIIDRLIDYDDEMNNNEEEDNNEEGEMSSAAAAAVSEDDADNNDIEEEEEGDSADGNDSDENEEENNIVNDETSSTANLIQQEEQVNIDCSENNDEIVEQQEPVQEQQEDYEEKYLSAENVNDNNDKVEEDYNDDNNDDGFDDDADDDDEFDDDAFLPNATTFEDHHDDDDVENNEEQQELQSNKVVDDVVVDNSDTIGGQQEQQENDEMSLEKTELTIVEPEQNNDGTSHHHAPLAPPPAAIESTDMTEKEEEEEGWTYDDEAALMAELDSSSRSDDDEEEKEVNDNKTDDSGHGDDDGATSTSVDVIHANEDVTPHSNVEGGDDKTIQEEEDAVIDQQTPPSKDNNFMGIQTNLPNTFNGKNGGVAEDADLLAELRAISNKSSVDRFDTGVEVENTVTAAQLSVTGSNVATDEVNDGVNIDAPSSSSPMEKKKSVATFDVDFVVAASPTPPPMIDPFQNAIIDEQPKIEPATATVPTLEEQTGMPNDTSPSIATTGIKSNLPNTFNGKNGGAAEDADLLAELRAISNKSSVDRFDTGVEEENSVTDAQQSSKDSNVATDEVTDVVNIDAPPSSSSSSPLQDKKDSVATEKAPRPLPPWKQKGLAAKKKVSAASAFDVDIVVVAAPPPPPVIDPFQNAIIDEEPKIEPAAASVPTLDPNDVAPPSIATTGIKSSLPNTFNGKNGGAAEDADLLAELRAISNKSSSDRFDNGDGDDNGHEQPLNTEAKLPVNDTPLPPVQKKNENTRGNASGPPKPWQKKRAPATKKESTAAFDVDVVVAAAPVPTVETIDPTQNVIVDGTDIDSPTPEESPAADKAPPSIETTAIKSSLPNTFNGKNGGIAEDADLLAELRAISNKTSVSRFDNGGDDDDNNAQSSFIEDKKSSTVTSAKESLPLTAPVQKKKESVATKQASRPLPPWKQKGLAAKKRASSTAFDVDVVVAAAPVAATIDPFKNAMCDQDDKAPISSVETTSNISNIAVPPTDGMGIKSSLPNTFNGKNGGVAEDADLLAELRAISNKTSDSRFDNGGDDDGNSLPSNKNVTSEVGADDAKKEVNPPTKPKEKSDAKKARGVPPWKQKGFAAKKSASSTAFNVDVVVAAAPAPPPVIDPFQNAILHDEVDEPSVCAVDRPGGERPTQDNMSIQSSLPNTFNGKNGGVAEDADLLAELRAISNKTSSSRFDGGEEGVNEQPFSNNETGDTQSDDMKGETSNSRSQFRDNGNENIENSSKSKSEVVASEKPWKKKKDKSSGPLPPWKVKRDNKKQSNPIPDPFQNAVLDEPSSTQSQSSESPQVISQPNEGIIDTKSALPNTFKGKNGGIAEDADLLAELRAISMKNTNDRFRSGDDEGVDTTESSMGSKQQASATVVAAPVMNSEPKTEQLGIKSSLPNTFKGDRGGSAEDADLLAELRAISKNSSSNRFADTDDVKDGMNVVESQHGNVLANDSVEAAKPIVQNTLPAHDIGGPTMSSMNPFPTESGSSAPEITITLEGLGESLLSTNWQIRKASYLFLQEKILHSLAGREPENQLSGDDVYSALDATIMKALSDKNAGALDCALAMSVTYSDCCKNACLEDNASQIMSLLLKGAAFASSRPSTLKTTQELVFKLIEVAPEGSSTADSIIDLIQQYGLKAKKPKVVQFAAKLVLQLVQEFGTVIFSVPKLSAVHETLVSNSNDKIRAFGIEVLAELCRTFGSKTPMQALVEKLKKSQQSQLDTLLDEQPSPTPPTRQLRCKRGVQITTLSPEEALAALKKSEEEEKLKRFATRPAVNLLQVLPQTCYKAKINEAKWSEKVEALNALIEAGGEQPFKICPPSGSINYTPLLRELKSLLSHTHYLVCSKALSAIGMLAEGVGEPLSSNLRPLCSAIVPLFKDKKVGKAVMSCLEKMFGNALSFDHFLDSSDSFLLSLDEKKEKNALVRKSVLEFLARCIEASGSHGTCDQLSKQHAEELCKIACQKLKDSDATTRKAATDVLVALLSSKDDAVVLAAKEITSSLQSTNPRAYKTLHLATKSGQPSDSSKRGASRPGTAPLKSTSQQPSNPGVGKVRPTSAPKSDRTANVKSAPVKVSATGTVDEKSDESSLPSLEESIANLSQIGIPQWGDDVDNGGVLAGIQSSNWKQRAGALNNLATFYESNGDREFSSFPFLFVLVKSSTKSFQESNFNVAKAILDLFKVIFTAHVERRAVPESFLYTPIVKLAAEKIGDRKLAASSSSSLDVICTVKDPQRVLHVAMKTVDGIKSPLVHDAMLVYIESFCLHFGVAALSQGVQDVLSWVLKECENNNMKVKNAARDVMGEMYIQLGPMLESFVKSKGVNSSVSSLMDKVFNDNTHDPNASTVEREMKCLTMSSSDGTKGGSSKGTNSSSMLSLPTTDLMVALKTDCLDRMNDTGDKKSWRNRKEALDEVNAALSKCGGLLSTDGKSFLELKQLATNLRLRINDSQSNLKPLAASVIGSLLSHLDDAAQAKLGSVVFPALVTAAMNDMKKTMRDAAVSALVLGTDRPAQNGGGTNKSSVEAFVLALESELSDAALKSSGLPEVLSFLSAKIETIVATGSESEKSSAHRPLAKVIVLSLLSSKSGSRSAAEKLLAVCSKSGFVPSSSLDKEIMKLLPAQQRTIRSFIPKLTKQDQDLIDTFKKASERPRRPGQTAASASSRQTSQVGGSMNKSAMQSSRADMSRKSDAASENDVMPENPLQLSSARSCKPKMQRLAMLGKGDSWPEYPEEPSSDSIQALRKSWASCISSSSIKVLFPQSGMRSHEDCMDGCDLISRTIAYSRENGDSSFLEMLDFIFKWVTCALLLRDHTTGFRKVLSLILDLFKRLSELSSQNQITDDEAMLLLPFLLDKAGVAKAQFKEEILHILSFVKTFYKPDNYGSVVCVKVLGKSKSNPSRPLAAEQCSIAVQSVGLRAIGKKGLIILGNALDEETVEDARKAYISLFECVVENMTGGTDKLFSAVNFSDKVKEMIMVRCSKNPAVAQRGSPKRSSLSSPTRKDVPRESSNIPKKSDRPIISTVSSSAVATNQLRARLQKSKEGKTVDGSHRLPPTIDSSVSNTVASPTPSPRITSIDTTYDEILVDINRITDIEGCSNMDIVRGEAAIELLNTKISYDSARLDPIQVGAFREKVASDFNTCLLTVASALKFGFSSRHVIPPLSLINISVAALTSLFRMQYCHLIKQQTVEQLINITVSALLDERINDVNLKDALAPTVKATNKLAMRVVISPLLDNSLNALVAVQVSLIDPKDENSKSEKVRAKFARVLQKLLAKVLKDRKDASPSDPFTEVEELGALLTSIDWMLEKAAQHGGGSDALSAPSMEMAKTLLLELVKCKKDEVRRDVEELGDDVKFIEPLLIECEQLVLGLHPTANVVDESNSFRERLEALKRQRESYNT